MSLDLSIFRDAAQYLRMSEEKRMEIMASQIAMAKTLGGPKPVWCPTPEDPDVGYIHGMWDGKVEGKYKWVITVMSHYLWVTTVNTNVYHQ